MNILKYAAVIVIIFSLGLVSRQFLFPDYLTSMEGFNEIYVPNGEQARLVLADSSKVWLNSGTKFRFPKSFDGKYRNVSVSGEAFFEVHKGKSPFVVSTKYGDIKVLGTKFNVMAYNNQQFQTTLSEGKIEFYNSSGRRSINPGQQLRISKSGSFEIEPVDHWQVSSWTEGIVSFAREPLSEVFKKLERHYNIKIKAEGTFTSIRFTGKLWMNR